MRNSISLAVVTGGAVAIGWSTLAGVLALLTAWEGGVLSFESSIGFGAVAAVPAGLGGWFCAAAVRWFPAATWPLVLAPVGLLAVAGGLTFASAACGPMPWDDPKMGPLLIALLAALASGPTFLACAWARWAAQPTADVGAAPDPGRK